MKLSLVTRMAAAAWLLAPLPARAGWTDVFSGKGSQQITPAPTPQDKEAQAAPVAAVRGLEKTGDMKNVQKDYKSVETVEKPKVTPGEVREFKKEGRLKSAPPAAAKTKKTPKAKK